MKSPGLGSVLSEAGAYGVATVVAFGVDLTLLTLLVKYGGIHYAVAASLSYTAGAIALYALCVRFVFPFRRVTNRALELPSFVALGLVGLALQTAVMTAAVEGLHLYYLTAKLSATGCTFVVNFLLRRTFLFTRSPAAGT